MHLVENIGCQNPHLFSLKDEQNHWESCLFTGSGKLSLGVHKIIKSSLWNQSQQHGGVERKPDTNMGFFFEGLRPKSVQNDRGEEPFSPLDLQQ